MVLWDESEFDREDRGEGGTSVPGDESGEEDGDESQDEDEL